MPTNLIKPRISFGIVSRHFTHVKSGGNSPCSGFAPNVARRRLPGPQNLADNFWRSAVQLTQHNSYPCDTVSISSPF